MVAAKVLTGLADERVFQSFVHEAAILRDMRDRNIVQFVGVCMGREEEGQPDEVRAGGRGAGGWGARRRQPAAAARLQLSSLMALSASPSFILARP